MSEKYTLTSGEFARLCGTTKETILHYDRAGILKPRYVSKNGYRRYTIEQFWDFDVIAMFKETGNSLEEIKTYTAQVDPLHFLALLKEKQKTLKEEQRRLAHRQKILEDIVALTYSTLRAPYDTLDVLWQEEERLEVMSTESEDGETTQIMIERTAEYLQNVSKQGRVRYPMGTIIAKEDVLRKSGREHFYFYKASRYTPKIMLFIKPAGHYAVLLHNGTRESHAHVYANMIEALYDQGPKISGCAYLYDMMSYITAKTSDAYAIKYCIQVECAAIKPHTNCF